VLLTKFNVIPQNDRHREKNMPGDNWPRAAQKNLRYSFARNIDRISKKSLFTSSGK